ncbi:uncharacterized protein K489DRAFT_385077 [Dissoconium aciculare CBS 342.82]|uniref:Uncharacterized protein n=1 Tax=Dissoconium aciculare CBS 342.82 TaxID=1314786 RepID=A0A6J3LR04_9PEZI|nr:uncharacterized protein K489DRAFT_385077 [Dissoconium aciculare CBS 342.82]KAF1818291.1 hypothetical protein K489DRAFT_385077 [Dissoconium aciculare CBS 342.82]
MNNEALQTMIESRSELPEQLLNELGPRSPTIREMHDRFRKVSNDIQILSVYETLETPTVIYDASAFEPDTTFAC